jgi:hypothetical protein
VKGPSGPNQVNAKNSFHKKCQIRSPTTKSTILSDAVVAGSHWGWR